MTPFKLKIVTPDGLKYDGMAEMVVARTTTGEIGIMAKHINLVAPLGMGRALITVDGKEKKAACIGGILSVISGEVSLVPTTFEWAEDIDVKRAENAMAQSREAIAKKDISQMELKMAEARLKRALVRLSVASDK
ncbi:MAG: ATP synthase F1 subunit epsilon [Clostridia bacterium]|nr:ATP synthase F1 subunit epsilon [Clostridia bacterium]MBQ9857066.1 ATP synthase F1 subunit epsilon [Clostridia bacterium]